MAQGVYPGNSKQGLRSCLIRYSFEVVKRKTYKDFKVFFVGYIENS